jgi:hypothetical protein
LGIYIETKTIVNKVSIFASFCIFPGFLITVEAFQEFKVELSKVNFSMLELKFFSTTAKIWLCPKVLLGYRFKLKLSRLFSFLNEKEERPQTKLKKQIINR